MAEGMHGNMSHSLKSVSACVLRCRYLVGGYLSAEAVVNMFSKAVMETTNWPSISSTLDCLVRPVLGGPDLRLEIRCAFVVYCSFQC